MEMSIFKDYKRTDRLESSVWRTKDYDKFIIYEWNRDVDERNLARIGGSVKKYGWQPDPIIVNEEMGIIDGQHRYEYAKRHNLPIYYTIVKGLDVSDCMRMNSKRKAWTPKDYVKYYAALGNQSYINLYYLIRKYDDMPMSLILYAIDAPKGMSPKGNKTGAIRDGKYECDISSMEKVEENLKFILDLKPYMKIIKGRQDQLGRALLFTYNHPEIRKDRLEKVIIENCHDITPPANLEIAFKEIERVYNKNLGSGQVYVYTEWRKKVDEANQKFLDHQKKKEGEVNE